MRKKIIILALAGGLLAVVVGGSRFLATSAGAEAIAQSQARMNVTPAAGVARQTHLRQIVDGQAWSLTSFTNQVGQTCAGEKVPNDGGDGGQGLACRDRSTLFANSPLVYFVGARQLPGDSTRWANAWVWGWASPQVSRLELQLNNCTAIPLAVDDQGLFFKVFGSATIHSGLGPQQLIAYNAAGAVIDSQPTPVSAPSSPRAQAAGATGVVRVNCG